MAMTREQLRELAQQMADHMGIEQRPKPKLALVGKGEPVEAAPRQWLQPFERDMRYQLIRDIARLHGLQWLIRKETAHVDGIIEHLDDPALLALHATMQRAQECILEGIGFDDAGLL